jgi:hypothetical protein
MILQEKRTLLVRSVRRAQITNSLLYEESLAFDPQQVDFF